MTIIRIIIADDHPIFRDGLARSLAESGQFEVMGVGESADDAVALVQKHAPDLALLDLSMPGGGVNAVTAISALDDPPRIELAHRDHVGPALN